MPLIRSILNVSVARFIKKKFIISKIMSFSFPFLVRHLRKLCLIPRNVSGSHVGFIHSVAGSSVEPYSSTKEYENCLLLVPHYSRQQLHHTRWPPGDVTLLLLSTSPLGIGYSGNLSDLSNNGFCNKNPKILPWTS